MTLVFDASVLVTWVGREDGHAAAHRRFAIDAASAAPSLLPIEVASTLWKKVRGGEFAPAAATEAGARLAPLPMRDVGALDAGAVRG